MAKRQSKKENIRDPIHKWIDYDNDIKKIINHPLFQRLRRVKQLSCVDQVFPGAVHTRFSHSLGVMHMSRKYAEHLFPHSKNWIRLAQIAGLLHDIGHGPYSHTYDLAVYAKLYSAAENSHWPDGGHDVHRHAIIREPTLAALIENAGVHVDELSKVWNAGPDDGIHFIIYTIVSGPLGADRMDFVMRDAYFCGTEHLGTIAHERIISASSIRHEDDKIYLLYDYSCLNDIIHALDGRRYMYHDIYFHRVAVASCLLIDRFLQLAVDELDLFERTKDLSLFVDMDEEALAGRILCLPLLSPARIAFLRYRNRQLPRFISCTTEIPDKDGNSGIVRSPDGIITYYTRPFTGVDPNKFQYYNIRFITKEGTLFTCSEALEIEKFQPIPAYQKVIKFQD